MTGDTFKITIHGEGLNVEREISVHVVTRILPFILGGQAIEQSLRLASSTLVTLQETLNLLRDILLDEIVPQESE